MLGCCCDSREGFSRLVGGSLLALLRAFSFSKGEGFRGGIFIRRGRLSKGEGMVRGLSCLSTLFVVLVHCKEDVVLAIVVHFKKVLGWSLGFSI